MKKLFFWICLLSFSLFATNALANLPEKESVKAEKTEMHQYKKSNPRPFKCTVSYNALIPGIGMGKATHMGWIITDSFFDPSTGIGTEKIYASDGSELYMTWDMENYAGTWQITGGTGRFVDATGSGEWSGFLIPDSPFFTIIMSGNIVF